jgi:hypothetical protein
VDLIFGEQRREYRIQTQQKIYFASGPSTPAQRKHPSRAPDQLMRMQVNGG